jgi:pilus assembly protein CpaB
MKKPTNIFLLAIVLGSLSAALIYRHLHGLRLELETARRAATEVVVAGEKIPIGSRIEAYQLRTVAWPSDLLPDGALKEAAPAVGKVVRTSIEKNQPLLQSQLIGEGRGLLPLLITEGMRAMSVKVDDVAGVSGFITPSSRVDVLAAGNAEGSGQDLHGKVILQNVTVLATGKSIEQRDNKPVEVPTVTLLVSPNDAEKLTLATRRDPVRLALRNFQDEAIVRTAGVSGHSLYGQDGGGRKHGADDSVEVLLGAQVTRQSVRRSDETPEEAPTAPRLGRDGGGAHSAVRRMPAMKTGASFAKRPRRRGGSRGSR